MMTARSNRLATIAVALLALVAAPVAGEGLDPGAARTLEAAKPAVQVAQANPCNPCGKHNACNPCAKKNACNPCAGKHNPCNPCGAKRNPCNPCNPCGGAGKIDPSRFQQPSGEKLATGSHSEMVALGEKLWNDRTLGSSGIACATCHQQGYGQMNDTFDAPYPHYVAMPAQQAGVSQVNAAEMVNFCMIVPMQDDPLAWESRELAALAAYVEKIQTGFEPGAGKRTAAGNPCNPCGSKANACNPCARKKGNPCNPCGR